MTAVAKGHRARLMGLALGSALAWASVAVARTEPTGPSLPLTPPPFAGTIGKTYLDSKPAFTPATTAPKGAPNIIVVMTDDVGFGAASTFGGPIPTPNLDRLAARGLIYNRFHTTAMCSPTRAALLTGRNHHAVDNGIVANLSTGFPGYDNELPKSAATVAEILRQYGYNTAMIGKHHNAPEHEVSAQGPFDRWPTGLGFEYFYGFMGAETNQFSPALYRGVTPVDTIRNGTLDKALADEAIGWIHNQKAVDPAKPFFLYFATGSAHAPLQAPPEWIARFRGKFDQGWDKVRADSVTRMMRLGMIPKGTQVSPRPEGIKGWSDLSPDQKRITARMMEVYAGMLAYQDNQFGRLLDELDRMGQTDNTMIVFIEGDNGAAAEGGPMGSMNPMSNFANGTKEDDAALLAGLDKFGGPEVTGNYADGWAWAMNAPNPWVKQYASHLGGVRNGMVISWPGHIAARGIRPQFSHVTDIMPTLLDAAGIEAPASVNGVRQQAIDGVSLTYSFTDPRAPERHDTQYFEMMGNRAIYHDGWWAGTTPRRMPWGDARQQWSGSPEDYKWELYDLKKDPAQAHDLAASNGAKLAEMRELFDQEARANNVYPLDDRMSLVRFQASAAQHPNRNDYVYWGSGISIPAVRAAPILGRSFTIDADIDLPDGQSSGTLVALGSQFSGWSFHLDAGKPVVVMAASQLPGDQSRVAANAPLPAGRQHLQYEFRYDGGRNAGGEIVIRANGEEIGRGRIARTISKLTEMTDTMDIGFDADTPVVEGPASQPFSGRIDKVSIALPPVAAQ
ncbi:arylsulfatase [Sphingobium sp. EM0848]|uniref:arylsulfatase n=1 Tax=Sphingobium sp. EM0848 TaxID=2743473 RepID=UPI002101695B|nr:arylsulfatase [Sphingobium sp. EM0848]